MQISHESPLCLLEESRKYNDYDYALVHLFDSNGKYYNFFEESLKLGRRVILDNSIFELGTAFDAEEFSQWIHTLNPTDYIVPDVLEDCDGTIAQFESWIENHGDLPGNKIGVVHGKTYEEMVKCYQYMERNADKIAFNFVDKVYDDFCMQGDIGLDFGRMTGRMDLIQKMVEDGIINTNIKHHILGCVLPQAGKFYKQFDWIESVDTSNPIIHGILNIKYQEQKGLFTKNKIKMVDIFDKKVDREQWNDIQYNIEQFRKIWSINEH